MNRIVNLTPRYPHEFDSKITTLVKHLGLDNNDIHNLDYIHQNEFEAEVNCCHLNVWVKIKISGGSPLFGWVFLQDKKNDFVEAIFHSVWKSDYGTIYDITPRENGDKKIMFIEDQSRQIKIVQDKTNGYIKSFDSVRFYKNHLDEIKEIFISPQTDMIRKYQLNIHP